MGINTIKIGTKLHCRSPRTGDEYTIQVTDIYIDDGVCRVACDITDADGGLQQPIYTAEGIVSRASDPDVVSIMA